ncbi:dynein regulatory complex protein 9 isoform X4 [Aotus nancymaae]|uniref:dynein regulatory complex protein 9 isoform X4 n=1 Tax=Aotus nancymaae TaxID=37293 RepID=UPI0030FF09E8
MEEDSLEDSNLSPKVRHSEMTVSVTGEPPSTVEEEGLPKETGVEIIPEIPEIPEPLSPPDVLRVSAVLEGTIDQLSMPIQYEGRQSISMKSGEMNLEENNLHKLPMASTITKIPRPLISKEELELPEIRQRGQFPVEFNKMQDLIFKNLTRQTIMTTETLKKIQIDRQFFSDVIADTMKELQDLGTFNNLLQALSKEREKYTHFYDVIARGEKGRKQIKSLQKQLINVKKEWQFEVQKLRMKTEEETRVHMEIEMFLRKEQQKLEEKLEFWMEKYDKDTEMKQKELNALKAAKASDLAHLQDLAKTIREYEQIIAADRIEKEKSRKKVERDLLELKSVLKIQAWWRGTVIRKEIGGFRRPKDKVGSKYSKGKGKGKDKKRGQK